MKKVIFISAVSLIMAGCATLTRTQIESVNQFARITDNFSDYPGKIMAELASIRTLRGVYYANSLSSPQLHIDILDSVLFNETHALMVSEKSDITFRIIDNYSRSLALLSSDRYTEELKKQSKDFGENVDVLISKYNIIDSSANLPAGIGSAAAQLVLMGGKQYIRSKQAKEIKKVVPRGDTLISVMTDNLLKFLSSENINQLILAEESGINQDYLSFIRHSVKTSISNDLEYLALKRRIDGVKLLQLKTIRATESIRAAHKELLSAIKKRKNLKESLEGIKEMALEVRDLKSTVEKIEIPNK